MRLNKLPFICALLIITAPFLRGQNLVNIWYFGDSAGIDFNSGSAVVLNDGAMDTEEGCATICNAAGSLLFYTNGLNVWNRNHVFMPNGSGLLGDISSTQCGVIVPKPGSNTLYYVFTTDDLGGVNGLRFSEVDMTLNGGLGDVTANKNILLTTPVAEKVTAVNHSNNTDFWVISHGWNNNTYYAFEVTAAGVNTTPIVSNVGQVHGGFNLNSLGYMKGSHDGSEIATAIYNLGTIEISDFDNSSGVISPPFASLTSPTFQNVYGLEYSPSNQYLYISIDNASGNIVQFDVTLGTSAAIQGSAIIVGSIGGGTKPGALQLAPDNKIYIARDGSSYLNFISNPDGGGATCGYTNNGLFLNGDRSWYGLPNFIQNIFILPDIIAQDSCLGDVTSFTLTSTANIDSVRWNFDDPASGAANFSTLISPTHIFSDSGWYYTYVILYHSGVQDTVFETIHIVMPPYVDLGPDLQLCPGFSTQVDVFWPGATIIWSDGSTDPVRTFSTAGSWTVTLSNRCSSPNDQINIFYFPDPVVTLRMDTTICDGESILLDAGPGFQDYSWSTGASTQEIWIDEDRTFTVVVHDLNGCVGSDEMDLNLDPCSQYLFIPTGFTPNGDGLNDLFGPVLGGNKITTNLFLIFDRWGNLIFESKGQAWNGKVGNIAVPEGGYSWFLDYINEFGDPVRIQGMVTLVR